MKIKYLKQFLDDVAKLNIRQAKRLKERLELFLEHPTHPALRNHKLKGKLKNFCSINITGDIRAIYKIKKHKKELIAEFIRLGTHTQLY